MQLEHPANSLRRSPKSTAFPVAWIVTYSISLTPALIELGPAVPPSANPLTPSLAPETAHLPELKSPKSLDELAVAISLNLISAVVPYPPNVPGYIFYKRIV